MSERKLTDTEKRIIERDASECCEEELAENYWRALLRTTGTNREANRRKSKRLKRGFSETVFLITSLRGFRPEGSLPDVMRSIDVGAGTWGAGGLGAGLVAGTAGSR